MEKTSTCPPSTETTQDHLCDSRNSTPQLLSVMEQARTEDLMRLLPKRGDSVLDIGTRQGRFALLLAQFYQSVTALDLTLVSIQHERITPVQGDITALAFPDTCFDCVFCTEVLEHVAELEKACVELVRVTRMDLVIGVPYKQDLRLGRTTCRRCQGTNPPWGHLHRFDEDRLRGLFPSMNLVALSFVGLTTKRTNSLSAWLMNKAGNPWGTYGQEEICIYCGAPIVSPPPTSEPGKILSAAAIRLDALQQLFISPQPNWLHAVFSKQ
jgi:SAM-dependent methyltransferase